MSREKREITVYEALTVFLPPYFNMSAVCMIVFKGLKIPPIMFVGLVAVSLL